MTKGNTPGVLRRLLTAAPVLALCVAQGACSDDDEPHAPRDGVPMASDQAGQAGTLTGMSPLTGSQIGAGAPDRPVIVVKVDNTRGSAPQVGLSAADLVVEQLVEGGSTRLAAFYWQRTPVAVGPVRSMRATDIGIVSPLEAVLVASGAAPRTTGRVDRAGIATVREGVDGFSRDGARTAPYDLVVDVQRIAGSLGASAPTASYLPFGGVDELPSGAPASTVDVAFSAAHTTSWRHARGTGYVRVDGPAARGDDFVPQNLLALDVTVGNAGYRDPAGNPVPESNFFGRGDAVLFHAGRAIRATWSKDGPGGALQLSTRDGEPLGVPPGHTWIELVPRDDGLVTYSG